MTNRIFLVFLSLFVAVGYVCAQQNSIPATSKERLVIGLDEGTGYWSKIRFRESLQNSLVQDRGMIKSRHETDYLCR
jgi:hypothetical protein